MTLYNLMNRQARGGFHLNHKGHLYAYQRNGYETLDDIAGGGGAAWGMWQTDNRTIWLEVQEIPVNASAKTLEQVPYIYAERALHELFHVASTGTTYTHEIMEKSAWASDNHSLTQAIRRHCMPAGVLN